MLKIFEDFDQDRIRVTDPKKAQEDSHVFLLDKQSAEDLVIAIRKHCVL